MKSRNRSPPKKLLPSSVVGRDIAAEWCAMYTELRKQGFNQTEAIDRIRYSYGNPSRTCVRRYVCPQDREKQRKYSSKRWTNYSQQQKVEYSTHKAKYRRVIRHLDEYLEKAYDLAKPRSELPLDEVSEIIQRVSGIYIRPSTLLRTSERYAQEKGRPLLDQPHHSFPPVYWLGNKKHLMT